jgi:hypothetical protein
MKRGNCYCQSYLQDAIRVFRKVYQELGVQEISVMRIRISVSKETGR